MTLRLGFLVVGLALPSCAELAYRPEEVVVPDADAFATVVSVVRVQFPRLVECDPQARRLQSAWTDFDGGAVPGRRRVTVFPLAAERVGIVVERSWLRTTLAGEPYWTSPAGDATSERELGAAIRTSLAAAPPSAIGL